MKKQNGYILFLVLLFMQLCAVLGLYALDSSIIQAKIEHQLTDKYHFTHVLEAVLKGIENSSTTSCFIEVIQAGKLSQYPLSWWQEQTCTGNFQTIQYYYVLESLGEDPCAVVARKKGITANYYRVTLRGSSNQDEKRVLLQSVFIQSNLSPHQCDSVKHTVMLGRQSLRAFF